MSTLRAYVPAAGQDRWLKFYDPLTKLLGAPAALRTLLEQADPRAEQHVLEIGCGTGNLTLMLKQRHPRTHVVALDPDAHALDVVHAVGAAQVAANGRCWWRNSALLINVAFPIRYFDGLGVPRLVT